MDTIQRSAMAGLLSFSLMACVPASQEEASTVEIGSRSSDALTAAEAAKRSLQYVQQVAETSDALEVATVERLSLRMVSRDDLGGTHTRLRQTVAGVPVFGGEIIVHLDADGRVQGHTDGLVEDVKVDTQPAFDEYEAIEIAVEATGSWDRVSEMPKADLQILRYDGRDFLTYRVEIRQFEEDFEPAIPVVFVDAHSRAAIWGYDDLKHVQLSDADKRTYDMNNGTNYGAASIADSSDSIANDAHTHAGMTIAYFQSAHNRDSFSGTGTRVDSYVHYSSNYVNAYWDGSRLTYGDGDGVNSGPLTTLDIVAHEFAHGVTDYSADLIYANESGALNEATSDIFAAAVEAAQGGSFTDIWYVGEDTWLADTALRYMDDPARAGDYDYYPTRYTGSADNGGVHWNSGIANLFFHLLSVGGTHPRGATSNVVTGIGINNAASIWYRALTVYMTPSTTFAEARVATVNAASDLNASWVANVESAWDAVGVVGPPAYVVIDTASNQSGSSGAQTFYGPYDATTYDAIKFQISGGSGDADLYVRFGANPTTSTFDCRPYLNGNNETCEFNPSQSGNYYVMIRAYTTYSGVTLTVSADLGSGPPPEICNDGIDNDGDGATDCADSDCANDPACAPPAEICDDGIDNDGDGATDCADSDCAGDPACAPPAEICDDGIDNDGDGATDCADSDCANDPACAPPAEICDDGIDNDGDGATDCADSDCTGDPACTGSWVQIANITFESGWGDFIDGGSDARRSSNDANYAHGGTYCARIRDNSGSASSFYSSGGDFNTAGRSELEIDFWFYSRSMEFNEDFFVELSANGGPWTTVGNYARGTHFNNNQFSNKVITVNLGSFGNPSAVDLRFRNDASGNSDWIYVDDIVVSVR